MWVRPLNLHPKNLRLAVTCNFNEWRQREMVYIILAHTTLGPPCGGRDTERASRAAGHLMQVVADNSIALDHTRTRTEPTQAARLPAGHTIRQWRWMLVACDWLAKCMCVWSATHDASRHLSMDTDRRTDGQTDGNIGTAASRAPSSASCIVRAHAIMISATSTLALSCCAGVVAVCRSRTW